MDSSSPPRSLRAPNRRVLQTSSSVNKSSLRSKASQGNRQQLEHSMTSNASQNGQMKSCDQSNDMSQTPRQNHASRQVSADTAPRTVHYPQLPLVDRQPESLDVSSSHDDALFRTLSCPQLPPISNDPDSPVAPQKSSTCSSYSSSSSSACVRWCKKSFRLVFGLAARLAVAFGLLLSVVKILTYLPSLTFIMNQLLPLTSAVFGYMLEAASRMWKSDAATPIIHGRNQTPISTTAASATNVTQTSCELVVPPVRPRDIGLVPLSEFESTDASSQEISFSRLVQLAYGEMCSMNNESDYSRILEVTSHVQQEAKVVSGGLERAINEMMNHVEQQEEPSSESVKSLQRALDTLEENISTAFLVLEQGLGMQMKKGPKWFEHQSQNFDGIRSHLSGTSNSMKCLHLHSIEVWEAATTLRRIKARAEIARKQLRNTTESVQHIITEMLKAQSIIDGMHEAWVEQEMQRRLDLQRGDVWVGWKRVFNFGRDSKMSTASEDKNEVARTEENLLQYRANKDLILRKLYEMEKLWAEIMRHT